MLWEAKYGNIQQGQWCPQCVGRVSKIALKWIESIPNKDSLYNDKKSYEYHADAYDPKTNTIYELLARLSSLLSKHRQQNARRYVNG